MSVSNLIEIANLANVLAYAYPRTAANYYRLCKSANVWREQIKRRPDDRLAQQSLDKDLRFAASVLPTLQRWRNDLIKLSRLVPRYLPQFDGELRYVSRLVDWHEDQSPDDWEPLIRELGWIGASATRQVHGATDSVVAEATKRPKIEVKWESSEIVVDGKPYHVDDPDALTLFEGMIANYPEPFHASKQEPELRPRNINGKLPAALKMQVVPGDGKLWTSGRGKGGCKLLIDPR